MSRLSSLSEREHEILELLRQGMSDAEIAARLVLQRSTVKWYNRQIFNKLDVNNRREAVRLVRSLEQRAIHAFSLPASPTPFVGRASELRTVSHLLRERRLVTIIAPGGMGKSRLILACAEALIDVFPDGVVYVPLEAVPSSDPLAPTLLRALRLVIQQGGDPETQLIAFLRSRSLLLILDNFEHLLDHTPLLSNLLIHAPKLKLLVGSRERLRLHGETVFSLGGLSVAADSRDDSPSDALDLLMQCIVQVIPDFKLDPADRDAAITICRLTGGMPLAIELAAGWLDTLSLVEVAQTLANRRGELSSRVTDLPERHASIDTVLEATWAQLSDTERAVFMRLSVFQGGCTRAAARALTGADVDTLSSLVSRGLIRLHGPGRYRFHELLRQYGEERLITSGLLMPTRDAHSHYYLSLLAEQESDIKGLHQSSALEAIDSDFENIRAAWLWGVQRHATDDLNAALESLYWLCEFRDRVSMRVKLLSAAVSTYTGTTQSVWLAQLLTRAWSDGGLNALPRTASITARRMLRTAWAYLDRSDSREYAVALYQRGLAAASVRHLRAAITFFARAAACPDPFYAAQALLWQAFTEVDLMDFGSAEAHARTAVQRLRAMGEQVGLARALLTLGAAVENKPDYAEAERCYEEAYGLLHRLGAHTEAANVGGWYLAGAALRLGDFERHRSLAQELLRAADAQNSSLLRARALTSLTAAGIVSGDYALARTRGMEAVTLAADGGSAIVAPIFLSYVQFLLGDRSQSQATLLPILRQLLVTRFAVFDFVALPLVAALLEANGFREHALTALSLSLNHPASMRAWAKLYFERSGLIIRLEALLGDTLTNAALGNCPPISAPEIYQWLLQISSIATPISVLPNTAPQFLSLPRDHEQK